MYDEKLMDEIKEDRICGVPQMDRSGEFEDSDLLNYDVESVMDDTVMVKYIDGSDSVRGGIHIPQNMEVKAWVIGKVMLTGPKSSLKTNQYVFFSRDRGLPARDLNGESKVIFIRDSEIMGVLKKKS
jgi:co-chaperonin GroES (HSP10)